MGQELFVALINPALALMFACAFITVWRAQKARLYTLYFAAGFATLSAAFIVHDLLPISNTSYAQFISNSMFFLAIVIFDIGILRRSNLNAPKLAFIIISIALVAYLFVNFFIIPNDVMKSISINTCSSAIMITTAFRIIKSERNMPSNLIAISHLLIVINFIARSIVITIDSMTSSQGYIFQANEYWTSAQTSAALLTTLGALCLLVAFAWDLIDDVNREARRDKLTGVLNRGGFEQEARTALRECDEAVLVLTDLDHFKSINDQFGHHVGDEVLRCFGAALRAEASGRFIIGRVGGEEFAALMPEGGLHDARTFADGIRRRIVAAQIEGLPPSRSVTASCGIHAWRQGETLSQALRSADMALYRAKDAGRDNIVVACLQSAGEVSLEPSQIPNQVAAASQRFTAADGASPQSRACSD